ncbi:hypothetical protein ACTXT7_017549, partial [Hymenolepis weldensis]
VLTVAINRPKLPETSVKPVLFYGLPTIFYLKTNETPIKDYSEHRSGTDTGPVQQTANACYSGGRKSSIEKPQRTITEA